MGQDLEGEEERGGSWTAMVIVCTDRIDFCCVGGGEKINERGNGGEIELSWLSYERANEIF